MSTSMGMSMGMGMGDGVYDNGYSVEGMCKDYDNNTFYYYAIFGLFL